MWIVKLCAFVILAGALWFTLPYLPPVQRELQAVACEPGETYRIATISNQNEYSSGWHCVDAEGRFNMSETSVRDGELAAAGIAMGTSCFLAAIPFGVMWLLRKRTRKV